MRPCDHYRKASEQHLPEDERRGVYVLGDDPVEISPTARRYLLDDETADALAAGGTLELTYPSNDGWRFGAVLALLAIGVCLAVIAGIGCARLIVLAADAVGAAYLSG